MPFFPKNRVTENLYTNGGEYAVRKTGLDYTGYYHKVFTGSTFTGKNPQVTPIFELVPYQQLENIDITSPQGFFNKDSAVFNSIKNIKGKSAIIPPSGVPQPKYPTLTNDDYVLGEFQRYFLKKRNQPIYVEILKEDYTNIRKDKGGTIFTMYLPFFLPWKITGDPQNVLDTNRNITLLTERDNNLKDFNKFLTNYTEFYGLYTKGGEFTFEDSTPYTGLYHIMPNGQAMTGRTHDKYRRDRMLYQVGKTPLTQTSLSPSTKVGGY